MTKKLCTAKAKDFELLLDSTRNLGRFQSAQRSAQELIDIIYGHFQESLVLLRLFISVPFSALPPQDQELVEKKAIDSGTMHSLKKTTPVLTLLGTRGGISAWDERSKSQGFRCIPLTSTSYVASLSMLSMQLRKMNVDLTIFDRWDSTIGAQGHADEYTGMLYINDAASDRDDQGRMVVPRQDFVSANNVKSVFGFGAGYSGYPAIGTLFAFTNESLKREEMEPFAHILKTYLSISEKSVKDGRIFERPIT